MTFKFEANVHVNQTTLSFKSHGWPTLNFSYCCQYIIQRKGNSKGRNPSCDQSAIRSSQSFHKGNNTEISGENLYGDLGGLED